MSEGRTPCRRARITGRVQGVGFRAWTRQKAAALGLTGWVRNAPDGAVLVLLCGTQDQLDDMLRACHAGPRFARVDRVEVEDCAEDAPGAGFEIRY